MEVSVLITTISDMMIKTGVFFDIATHGSTTFAGEIVRALWRCGKIATLNLIICLKNSMNDWGQSLAGTFFGLKDDSHVRTADEIVSSVFTLVLTLGTIFASSFMLLSFLSRRPIDNTGRTELDLLIEVFPRIADFCTTVHRIAVAYVYVLAAAVGIYNLVCSTASPTSVVPFILGIWAVRPVAGESTAKHIDHPKPNVGIVALIQEDKKHYKELVELDTRQKGQITSLTEDLVEARQSEARALETVRALQIQNTKSAQDIKSGQQEIHALSEAQKRDVQQHNKLKVQQSAAHKHFLRQVNTDLESVRQKYAELLDTKIETWVWKHELSEMVSGKNALDQSYRISKFAVPFVLVLVDGDAYHWHTSHWNQTQYPPGASAAQAIKTEVQDYLVENESRIPLQSRIVVRVLQNLEGGDPVPDQKGRRTTGGSPIFSRDFTQTMPLFDYIDSGCGKERVDSKIQDLVHLFIANPACQTIFLAAATDNGFVRLLEQYAYNNVTRKKIMIVHPGYIIWEIDSLGYNSMQWPSVFENKAMPELSRIKAKGMTIKAATRKTREQARSARMMVEEFSGLGKFKDLSRGQLYTAFYLGEKKELRERDAERAAIEMTITKDDRLAEVD